MSTRHIAAESARLHDLTPEGSSGRASKRFRQRLASDGFTVDGGFRLKPGYLYTVVRAISARVNQNYDGWPSEELKKSYKTFIGKPVFVNHENHDPTKARGVVVAARYVENGMDKYVEVVQEIDAGRFPKLAHEIKTGGLDSVSMGAEAGFTICSYCHNKATDVPDMCDHVLNHKGKTLTRFDKRTGKKEDVLVFESCHKISFFELSYVFEPADETAVASKVVVAGLNKESGDDDFNPYDKNHYHISLLPTEDIKKIVQQGPGHPDYDLAVRHLQDRRDEIQRGIDSFSVGGYSIADPDEDQDPFDPRIIGAARQHGGLRVVASPGHELHVFPPHEVPEITHRSGDTIVPATGTDLHEWVHTLWGEPVNQGFARSHEEALAAAEASHRELADGFDPDKEQDPFDPRLIGASRRTAEDMTVPAPPGTPTVDQSVIDATPVIELQPATELTGHEAPGLGKQSAFDEDLAEIMRLAGQCPPGQDCNNMLQGEQITKDSPNNPVNQVSSDPNGTGGLGQTPGTSTVSGGGGEDTGGTLKPQTQKLQDSLKKMFPGVDIGGYRAPDGYNEHSSGSALDFMTTDHAQAKSVMDHAFSNGANYVIWDQKQWNPDGTTSVMEDRGSPTQNHKDHVHINIGKVAGKYTKDDFAVADGKKPWERDTESDADDAAAIEIEAMAFNPNTQHTQLGKSTLRTYFKAHDYLDGKKAPRGRTLDFGAGRGYSGLPVKDGGLGYHTFEPNPVNFVGKKGPTYTDCCDIPDASYKRVVSLNVLNVLDPHDEPGGRVHAVREVGRILSPGGHAILTTRPDVTRGVPPEKFIGDEPGAVMMGPKGKERRQKGFTRGELHEYVSGVLGDGYTVSPIPNNIGGAGVMVVRNHDNITASLERSSAVKKLARQRALKLAYGETEAPMAVDTLREEGSAPEDDDDDFEQYVKSPDDLKTPDLSQAQQIDREQEIAGAPTDQTGGVPGAAEGGPVPGQPPQQQMMTLQIPMPSEAPQVPQQAAPPVMPPQDPSQQPPMQMSASTLDYFDRYYGRRVANWLDAIEARREMTPAEAADYRRQAVRLSTLENGREHSTTIRNPRKEPADMARNNIASRSKVARAGRRQHLAEGPYTDGSPYGRNDEGEQEEAFISQVPPPVAGDFVTDEGSVSNTEHNLVARVQQGRDQLLRDARQLASLRQRRAFDEAGGPTAEVVDPKVHTGPEGEALTGTDFVSADPNDGVVPTNPKDASLRAFQAFDGWLAQKTGKSSRRHTEANIKKAAAAFSREAGISPQALFPALGIVLREARKNNKKANTKGAAMRKRADEKLEVAAPDGRIDVEAPVENVTSAEAQASQFDLHDFGNNAGDNVAKPDLSTDQNWAPGEASGKKASIKTAGGLLAMRCAEAMIEAGLEPNERERKYQLAAQFENMNRGLIQDRVALLERFAAVRQADLRRVASGSSRGAARSPIPAGLGGGTRTAAAGMRTAAHDPSNDSTLFI